MITNIKKFGLNYCDLPTILWNVGMFLRRGTMNINRKYASKPIPWTFYIIIFGSGGCFIYAYVISVIWFLIVRLPETGDIKTAAVELSLASASGTCVAKFLYMKLYVNTVMNIVDDYIYCDKLVVKNTRFSTNLLKHMRIVKKRAITVWAVLVVNALVYLVVPILIPGRHFPEDLYVLYESHLRDRDIIRLLLEKVDEDHKHDIVFNSSDEESYEVTKESHEIDLSAFEEDFLEVVAGLEPMFESPNYEIALLILMSGVYFAVFTIVHMIIFIIVIVGYLESLMFSLSDELNNIWDDSEKFYTNYMNINMEKQIRNVFIKNRLKDIVKFHIVCLNLRNKVDKELRVIFIIEFLCMILAIVTELIGGLENTYLEIPYTVGQVFITCLIGQRLIDASLHFEKSLYACRWENFDVSNQKTILLMLQCSYKRMTLSAGGVTELSFPCLMFIIKTTYSAYTTLKSSVNKSA